MLNEVSRDVLEAIRTAARAAYPQEACGILLGQHACITGLVPTRNVHPTPETHFEIDPQALIDALRAERGGGPAVVGYYHSHPKGAAQPSKTDQAMAAGDGKVWAIVAGDRVTLWRDDPGCFHPLSYRVVES